MGPIRPRTSSASTTPACSAGPCCSSGNIEDIFAENAFIAVKDSEFYKLGNPKIGTEFELNDHRGVIVGIAHVASSGLFGVPTLYTTYNRALQYIPNTALHDLLPSGRAEVAGRRGVDQAAGRKAGYLALTKDEFIQKISDFYMYQTGIGTNMLMMTVISFIVGLSISGQTFYTFVLENLEKFGALKAIGAKGRELIYMILFQATFVALTGYGIGVGLCTLSSGWRGSICRTTPPSSPMATSPRVRHGGRHRRDVQLLRRAQGAEDRAVRHLPRLVDGRTCHSGRGAQQMVRRGRGQDPCREGCELRGPFRRDALRRRALGQRQDHPAQHDLGDPAARTAAP